MTFILSYILANSSIVSVRISEDIKQKLNLESEMNNTTLNTLIGQILSKHVKWDRFAEDVGFVFLTKPFIRAILEHVDEKALTTIAVSTCRGAIRDATLFIKGELSVSNFLDGLDTWLNASHIPFRHITTSSTDKYIVQHDLGPKFSLYVGTVVNSLLNEVGHKATNQIVEDHTLRFEIEKVK